ncbi:MAG: sigma-54 dependent transcriptional regulator [Candidatus Eisenbacteria bacterium]
MRQILIVDDDPAVTNYLKVFMMQTGLFETTIVNDSREVGPLLDKMTFDIMLLDMDMPNVNGMDILAEMRRKRMDTPVVVLTGVSDVDLAVRAMKLGAFDYLTKPADDDQLLGVIDQAIEHRALRQTIQDLPKELSLADLQHGAAFDHFPTQDAEMIRIFHQAEKLAASNLSIFIRGESGTGKEAIGRAIHKASPRRDAPFVVVEASGQDVEDFPGFFFGQARNWSGSRDEAPGILEQANHGTLFLNQVDALSLPVQVRLLRVIQTSEYYKENSTQILKADARMIVASTKDLTRPDYKQTFLRDLLYHLMINSLWVPPLRERMGDLPLMAEKFLTEEAHKLGKPLTGFAPEFLEFLKDYSFPNNVQELRTVVAAAAANAAGGPVTLEALPPYTRETIEREKAAPREGFKPRRLDEVMKEYAQKTLEHFGSRRDVAAQALGISREELDRLTEEELD